MKNSWLIIVILLVACGPQKRNSENTPADTIISSEEVVTSSPNKESIEFIDSTWYANYVERQYNPDPEFYCKSNPDFVDWDSIENEQPALLMRDDTIIGKYSIRTYLLRDSLEICIAQGYAGRHKYCFYTRHPVMVIEDRVKHRRDSIIIFRKLIEETLDEDLSWTNASPFWFYEVLNDTVFFHGGWTAPDSDWGPFMEYKFINGTLSMRELIDDPEED